MRHDTVAARCAHRHRVRCARRVQAALVRKVFRMCDEDKLGYLQEKDIEKWVHHFGSVPGTVLLSLFGLSFLGHFPLMLPSLSQVLQQLRLLTLEDNRERKIN